MGVFGGIIVGLGVAALHNRFYTIELPSALAFFSGSRFVPIISTVGISKDRNLYRLSSDGRDLEIS